MLLVIFYVKICIKYFFLVYFSEEWVSFRFFILVFSVFFSLFCSLSLVCLYRCSVVFLALGFMVFLRLWVLFLYCFFFCCSLLKNWRRVFVNLTWEVTCFFFFLCFLALFWVRIAMIFGGIIVVYFCFVLFRFWISRFLVFESWWIFVLIFFKNFCIFREVIEFKSKRSCWVNWCFFRVSFRFFCFCRF